MKVGDLIRDTETHDVGLIIDVNYSHEEIFGLLGSVYPYRVTALDNGYTTWLEKDYIELGCEVISGGR